MENILTPREIADELKLNIKTIDKWLKNGLLRGFKVGKVWRVKENDYKNFVNNGFNDEDISKECLKRLEGAEKDIEDGNYITLDEYLKGFPN